ncbi:MAG: lipopolysaccharide biosynthesis protein [Sulfurimonadaceae bacterium]
MITKLKPKSEFSKNVLTLMTGTTIAQAIPIAISPILTRIYTPEDFGVLALFVAITAIFGSIANGRYELAIMLPKKDEDAINIFALGFIIVSCLSLFLLVLVIFFNDYFTNLLGNDEIGFWLYFIPLTVFFTGLWNILNYFNNRRKNYKDLRNATILKSIVSAVVQLSIGFVKQGPTGLITATIVPQFLANTRLLKNIFKDKILISKISKVKVIALAKRYRDFPKFSSWAALANSSSQNLTNILISAFFGITTLGFYSLVYRVLGIPTTLIGSSIGQVFFQQASHVKHSNKNVMNIFVSTLKKLIILSMLLYIPLFFVVSDVFTLVFGEKWSIAGEYAQLLLPFLMIKFIVSPLTAINQIYLKNKNVMIWQFGLIGIYMSILFFGNMLQLEFITVLILFSTVISSYYIFHLFLLHSYIKKEQNVKYT